MRIIIEPDPEQAARRAARMVALRVRNGPALVLALPTGNTPLPMYAELVRQQRERGLDFSRVAVFGLDEYVGIAPDDPRSLRACLWRHFLAQVNVQPDRCQGLDGSARDLEGECAAYEARIVAAGGLDLVVLGIGVDGHIGFNEPGSSLGSRTRIKTLTAETARANAGGFADPAQVPRLALTIGVGTILDARRCLLLATGSAKAAIIQRAVEGPVSAQITASALQLHPDARVVLDEAAAARLERADYYRETEALQSALPGSD